MKYPMDNQYRYGLSYDLNGQIVGFNLSPDLFICLTDDDIEKALETYVKRKLEQGEQMAVTEFVEDLPSVQPQGLVHIDDIYRLISGHSNYHGDNILAALTCLAEGKEVPNPITVLSVQPEPFINKPCVSEQACREDKMKVLEKIKADIEAKCCITVGRECDVAITLHDVFEIIDKYIAESEDKE